MNLMRKNIIYLAGCLMLLSACNNSKYDLENLVPQEYIKTSEYPPNCSRLTQQDLIIRELEEKRRSWADS